MPWFVIIEKKERAGASSRITRDVSRFEGTFVPHLPRVGVTRLRGSRDRRRKQREGRRFLPPAAVERIILLDATWRGTSYLPCNFPVVDIHG